MCLCVRVQVGCCFVKIAHFIQFSLRSTSAHWVEMKVSCCQAMLNIALSETKNCTLYSHVLANLKLVEDPRLLQEQYLDNDIGTGN